MRTALGSIPQRLLRHMSMGEAHDYLRARRLRSRREFLKDVAVAGAAAAAGPLIWVRPGRAADIQPAGVHLSVGNDPMSSFTVSWSTSEPVDPRLQIGTRPNQYGTDYPADTREIDAPPSLQLPYYHHATVTGLASGSEYFYRATHGDGDVGATGSFTTAPEGKQPFRFVAMGDMGATPAGATLTQRILAAQPDCVFMVGDLCYADRLGGAVDLPPAFPQGTPEQDLSQWDLWFAQIQASAAQVPWIFTVGNHEMEFGQGTLGYDGFRRRITLPGEGPSDSRPTYYVTRWGNVAFVALDANDVSYEIRGNQGYTTGAQQTWVGERLAALRADPSIDFIVVGFHHCMYCSNTVHGSDGGVRAAWRALFDQYQVDLVINGHNHSYERTHPMRGGVVTSQAPWPTESGRPSEIDTSQVGTVYVTAGAGGQAAYPSTLHPASYLTGPMGERVPETAEWSAVRYLGDHSLLVVDVFPPGANPARMEVKAIPNSTCTPSPCNPAPPEMVDRFDIVRADTAIIPVMSPGLQLPLAALLAAGGARALRARQA